MASLVGAHVGGELTYGFNRTFNKRQNNGEFGHVLGSFSVTAESFLTLGLDLLSGSALPSLSREPQVVSEVVLSFRVVLKAKAAGLQATFQRRESGGSEMGQLGGTDRNAVLSWGSVNPLVGGFFFAVMEPGGYPE
jgi:hypothetical protein